MDFFSHIPSPSIYAAACGVAQTFFSLLLYLQVTVNPNFHVQESDFSNNVVRCDITYTGIYVQTRNCRVTRYCKRFSGMKWHCILGQNSSHPDLLEYKEWHEMKYMHKVKINMLIKLILRNQLYHSLFTEQNKCSGQMKEGKNRQKSLQSYNVRRMCVCVCTSRCLYVHLSLSLCF